VKKLLLSSVAVSVTASLFFLISTFPAAALVGGAPQADQSIARHVVMVTGSDGTFCSGVVIARDLILTAAQCIHPATSYRIIGFDAPKTLKNVASTVVHPEWDTDAILRHRVSADVALVKLAAPLPPAYMPVALADSQRVVAADSQVIVAGYGVTKIGNASTGGKLRAANLVVTGNPSTRQIRLADPNTKGELAGLGACQGDSGGPVLDTSDGRLAVIGMISWSTGPALSTGCGGLTGVTPTIRYRDWIVKTAVEMGSAPIMAPRGPSEDSPASAQPASPAQEGLEKKQFTRVVASGAKQRLGFYTSLNPDCTARGDVNIRVTKQPEHGSTETTTDINFPGYPKEHVRFKCNEHKVRGVQVNYKSAAKYVGDDAFDLLALFPYGVAWEVHYDISVR
jgi:trypsin